MRRLSSLLAIVMLLGLAAGLATLDLGTASGLKVDDEVKVLGKLVSRKGGQKNA